MKKNIKVILSYALFIFLLIYIFKYANFDFHKLISVSLRDFLILSILSIIPFFLNGSTLKLSMAIFKNQIAFSEAFYVSQYFSLFNYLPLKAGIIAEGTYLKIKHGFPINKYIAGAILVYLANFLIYFLVGAPLILFFDFSRVFKIISPVYLVLFILIILACIFIYLFLPESVKDKHKYLKYLEYLFQSRKDLLDSGKYVIYLIFVSAAVLLVMALRLLVIFNVLNYSIPFHIVLMLAILAGFSFIVALTPGNLVVREAFLGGLTYIMIGDANVGIIASVFMRLFDLLWLIVFGAISSFKLSAKGGPASGGKPTSNLQNENN